MNKVIMLGRLTRDPELKYTKNNTAACSFGLAVKKRYKKEGEPDADFFNVVCFGKTAEFASKWFTKGFQILVDGSISLNEWQSKQGETRHTMEIFAQNVYFADSKNKKEHQTKENSYEPEENNTNENFSEIEDEGCPF